MRKIIPIVLLACLLAACQKDPFKPTAPIQPVTPVTLVTPVSPVLPPVTANGLPLSVSINQNSAGVAISKSFEGLSFETAILTQNPDVLNANNLVLIQLLKNLGAGLLRIGGDTSDETTWTADPQNTDPALLSPVDIDRLAAFSKAVGWPVLFGLNLGNYNVANAVNEAQYVYNSLGTNLYALQSGNEPDIYSEFGLRSTSYGFTDFDTDWQNYFTAIKAAVPQVAFAGPDASYNTDYVVGFAGTESKNVKLLDCHYYLEGPASASYITYESLIAPNGKLSNYLSIVKNAANAAQLPYRITETNNIYGGGKPGASNVFASTLWALDAMWNIAENKGQGINFHDGAGLSYSPVTVDNGVMTARPEYYAMLAFKYGSANGAIIPSALSTQQYNCTAHAVTGADGDLYLTLINEDENNTFSFTVQLSNTANSAQVFRLTAPTVTSATGITFAGGTVGDDGSFTTGQTELYAIAQKTFLVNIPPTSAAVIKIY